MYDVCIITQSCKLHDFVSVRIAANGACLRRRAAGWKRHDVRTWNYATTDIVRQK